MKRTILYIVRDSLLCLTLLVVIDAIIAICIAKMPSFFHEFSYLDILLYLLCNQEGELITTTSAQLQLLLSIEKLAEVVVLALLTSFLFSQLLNREVKIILPKKLVLRYRTSEGSLGQLNLGILIGNPKKQLLYDITCSIQCVYLKSHGSNFTSNTETLLSANISRLKNFYRFSFPAKDFPSKFWSDYLNLNEFINEHDALIVVISGHSNNIGGHFRIERTYRITDITIDFSTPENFFRTFKTNRFTNVKTPKFDWKEFLKTRPVSEADRNDVINDIKILAARSSTNNHNP